MCSTNVHKSIDVELMEGKSTSLPKKSEQPSPFRKFLSYPTTNSIKIKPTSWLDGVRGTAALAVYIFHAMGIWVPLVSAWHADEASHHFLQMPFIRSCFASGGAAVAVFFALSGYVLTHKSLGWIRDGEKQKVYPAVASSMFRRGFRLYLPPICITFFEMLSTRFGFPPPLSFGFQPEPTLAAQILDWLTHTNRFVNPFFTWRKAIKGIIFHPKYDAVVWTIPLEFYGSLVCYLLLFLLAQVPSARLRMSFIAIFSILCMGLGSWNMSCFSAGMLIVDFNLGQDQVSNSLPPNLSSRKMQSNHGKLWMAIFVAAFYVAGFPTLVYPEAKTQPMPGFETLRSLTPMSLTMEDHARFLWSISGILLLLSISQLPSLKRVFETNFCQYIGKIAFSLYLVHEFCLVLFGISMHTFMVRVAGVGDFRWGLGYWVVCGIWFCLFTIPTFAIAAQVERWIDAPSVRFARWLEGKCLRMYKRV